MARLAPAATVALIPQVCPSTDSIGNVLSSTSPGFSRSTVEARTDAARARLAWINSAAADPSELAEE
jgi:hypothetical protein